MTSWAHTGYLIRYLKQFGYKKQRNIRNGKVHRHKKSLFISNESHPVTIRGVLDYILKSTRYKQFPQKKKKRGDKGERQKKKKRMRKLWKKKEGRKEKRRGEVERRRKKIKRKTESAAQKMHRPLRTHSLAKS